MPWTFSHPAVVFPLKRSRFGRWLNLPALIIGSLSPDLLYSFGMYRAASLAHQIPGWFYTALPVCVMLLIICHFLAAPLKQILPLPVSDPLTRSLRDNAVLLVSLFTGALTHILWDSFTHETGTVVREVSLLQTSLLQGMTDSQEIRIYKVLQHLGSVLGLVYLILIYYRCQQRLDETARAANLKKLIRLIFTGTVAALITAPLAYSMASGPRGLYFNRFVFYELSLTVSVFFGLIFLAALWLRLRTRHNSR